MYSHTLALPVIHRRRALFLVGITQQVSTCGVLPEIARACAALAAIVGWGALFALIVG